MSDRRERYAAAIRNNIFVAVGSLGKVTEAVMAVADNEVQVLKAANARLRDESNSDRFAATMAVADLEGQVVCLQEELDSAKRQIESRRIELLRVNEERDALLLGIRKLSVPGEDGWGND